MRLGLLMRPMALDWTLSRKQRVEFGAPPQTWEQYSKEGRIWDLYIDRRREDLTSFSPTTDQAKEKI